MTALRRKLPPANGLVVFEAAGRHLEFHPRRRGAGADASRPSAGRSRSSRTIWGSACSSDRAGDCCSPARGDRLHRAVSMGLGHIAEIAVELRRHRGTGELTVATSVTFASYWLMARLARFRSQHGRRSSCASLRPRPSSRSGRRRHRSRRPLRQRRMGLAVMRAHLRQRDLAGLRAGLPRRPRAACATSRPCSTRRCSISTATIATG